MGEASKVDTTGTRQPKLDGKIDPLTRRQDGDRQMTAVEVGIKAVQVGKTQTR